MAQAVQIVEGVDATLVRSVAIGQTTGLLQPAPTPGAVYSDKTTFQGFAYSPAGAAASGTKTTALLLDDVTSTASGTFQLSTMTFSGSNLNSTAVSAQICVRFYANDGTAGGPGTLLGGINFNPIALPAGQVGGYNFNATTQNIVLTPNFWVGEFFVMDSSIAQASANKIGMGMYNPPDVGSSADAMFLSSAAGTGGTSSFVTSGPAGTVYTQPFSGAIANFEFEFSAVPEPSSMALVLPAGLLLGRRRRA